LAGFLYDYDLTTGRVEHFGGMGDVLGHKLDDVPPEPEWWVERIHPDDLSRVMQVANQTLGGRADAYLYEYRIRHRQGHYIHILDRGRIVRDDRGAAARVLGGVLDVSDRKRADAALHASEERFRLAAEVLAGFLYDWDAIADHLRWFGRTEDVLGFRAEELPQEGAEWRKRIHPVDVAAAAQTGDHILETGLPYWTLEYRIQHRDGHYIDILNRGYVVRDAGGRVTRVVGGMIDVTERRRFERERQALLAKAEAAVRARDKVLAVVSHDLGNAFSAIAFSATALLQSPDPSTASVHRILGAIQRSAESTHRLIRDLSDLASIDAGRLAIEPSEEDPARIVEQSVEMFAAAARTFGVTLEARNAPALPVVLADAERLLQAIANLVGNALKFTNSGGRITLHAEPDPAGVRFVVEDTGIGIAEEDLPHVFEAYWGRRRNTSEGGKGLGLAIVRGIVNAHGGEVGVESTPGKGSRFSFTIPRYGTTKT
jgi:PAS domain S-box-containing protein